MQSSRRISTALNGVSKVQCVAASSQVVAVRQVHTSRVVRAGAPDASEKYPSFARLLFEGQYNTASVAPYPAADVLSEDQKSTLKEFINPVTDFMENVNNSAENDRTASIPKEVREGLAEMGAYGLQVPEEYSGLGLSNTGYARLTEIIGVHDLGLGIHLGAHQSIGFKGILLFGTPEQKAKYLPDVATGKNVAAFVLTEPSTGSDANSVKTRATLGADGKWYLNGGKWFISNGGEAEIFTVFAQTEVLDPKTGEKKDKVTAFIVERAFGGVTNGPAEKKMGIKCSNTTELFFDNTPVPAENVLGGVGNGFKVAMEILNNGRFGMGAALTGTMKGVIKGATAHVAQRVQFGKTLAEFEGIKGKLANMVSRAYAAESMAYMLASNMDRGMKDYQLEAAISKVFASDTAWYVGDECIQLMGGLGFMNSLPYERVQRDLRIFRIFEGTNDILKIMIAGTGLQSLGKSLAPVLKNPTGNIGQALEIAKKLGLAKLNIYQPPAVKSFVDPSLADESKALLERTSEFSVAALELLMKYQKKLIDEQFILERVADIVIDITVSTATLARATRSKQLGYSTADHELGLAKLFVREANQRIKRDLALLKSGEIKSIDKSKHAIADQVLKAGGVHAIPPVGF